MGSIKAHLASASHKAALEKWAKRKSDDSGISQYLHDYFKANPREKDSSVDDDDQLYRWRVVDACMYSGVPLAKIDELRPLLERTGTVSLTASQHLKAFIPKIEKFEFNRLLQELKGQKVCALTFTYPFLTLLVLTFAIGMPHLRWHHSPRRVYCGADALVHRRV